MDNNTQNLKHAIEELSQQVWLLKEALLFVSGKNRDTFARWLDHQDNPSKHPQIF